MSDESGQREVWVTDSPKGDGRTKCILHPKIGPPQDSMELTRRVPWLPTFVEGVVIVGSILLAFGPQS
jgi:hypothetical protein